MDELVLYHAASAVCAAKVRLVLAEKSLAYESRLLDFSRSEQLAPDYLRLNPEGVVPTLVHNGAAIVESTVINEYLDDVFLSHPLRPADPLGRARSRLWTRREDGIHAVVNTLSTIAVFRPDLLARTAAEREARFAGPPDPARRAKLRELVNQGCDSPIVLDALIRLARHLGGMQEALLDQPWLGGDSFGLADAGLVSFFYRLEILQLDILWRQQFPAVTEWLAASTARPSFHTAIAAFLLPAMIAQYRQAGSMVATQLSRLNRHALAEIGRTAVS